MAGKTLKEVEGRSCKRQLKTYLNTQLLLPARAACEPVAANAREPSSTGSKPIAALEAEARTSFVAEIAANFAKPPDAAARAGRTHARTVTQSGQCAFPLDGGVVQRTTWEVDPSGQVGISPSRNEDSGEFGEEVLEHGQLSGMTTVADAIAREMIDLPGTMRRVAQSQRRCRLSSARIFPGINSPGKHFFSAIRQGDGLRLLRHPMSRRRDCAPPPSRRRAQRRHAPSRSPAYRPPRTCRRPR
ncbi:hypothetical protein C7410_12566 [Paraburkholderia silvatlantica]|uniref:Uncharacterized protein n=1 Tax=Paraburkholderia silvatlantica TaxID=321895 RepID=A0A2V4U5V8_9BURK|nr:hypothetical protein C7410_12566 [Paraburkholderia silvatlantica]